ncbi:MAG: hypothetical protein IJU48_11680 [Synergistaceae bacterium]|nr:hypothetical protein [Synergistaceae bacterium]
MKRSLLVLALVVFAATAAFAEVKDFGPYTIDVPAGWTAEQDGETVGFVKNDNSASMSISYDTTDGATLKEIADAFVEALKGKNLKETELGYNFQMTNDSGVESDCLVIGDKDHYALIVVTGGENAEAEVMGMIASIEEK